VYALCNPSQDIETSGRGGQTGDRPGAHDLLLELVLEGHKQPGARVLLRKDPRPAHAQSSLRFPRPAQASTDPSPGSGLGRPAHPQRARLGACRRTFRCSSQALM
ncbi:hypothetical protein MC885_018420, partial [Smutsia gigantea]